MLEEVKKPVLLALELTRHCRFHCAHCASAAGPVLDDGNLETGQWKKILKAIADYNKCSVIFTGGEPMERPDIYSLVSYADRLGLNIILATCGYLIDQFSIDKLKHAGISALSFSIDGGTAATHDLIRESAGSFNAVINAAAIARQNNVPFQVNSTISKINIDEVNEIIQLAENIGARCYNPFILFPKGCPTSLADKILDPVEYETLLNRLLEIKLESKIEIRVTCSPAFIRVAHLSNAEKRVGDFNGCIGATGYGFISCIGDVQLCSFLDVPAGNLVEENYDFKTIWEYSKLFNEIRDRSSYTGKCGLCDFLELCGGCRARAYTVCGSYLNHDPLCEYKKNEKQ